MIVDEAIISMHEHQTNCKVPKNVCFLTQGDNTHTRTC
jgi:hypothetical protein